MTIEEFELLYRIECRLHKIAEIGMEWVENTIDMLACYCPYEKIVKFTHKLLDLDYATAMWIIKHEIAHALDYRELGEESNWYDCQVTAHGKSWQRWCKVVGCPTHRYIPV